MNLTNFLKQIDVITAQYSAEQLVAFIHDIGRVLPEQGREDFLKRLKAVGNKTEKEPAKDAKKELEFHKMHQLVRKNLKIIDSQEITVKAIWNEDYDDWYDESSEEFYYVDDSGVSNMLAEACDFVHACMDMEQYKEGFQTGNQLLSMEILCINEYDGEELSLGDMVYHELLHCDLTQVILDTAYCSYHAVLLKKRPEVLYGVILNGKKDEVTLEAIMQHGDEDLPDFQVFLTLWIEYLGTKTGHTADRLILEAVGLLDDVFAAAQYAEEYAAVHPGLYLNLLESRTNMDADTIESIGMKAMKKIPKKYIMRSKVALKTAEYLMETNENLPLRKSCYFVAYESDTSALNYLRVLLNGYGTEKGKEELRKIWKKFSVQENGDYYDMRDSAYSERKQNKPDKNMILLLQFLDGQFADVLKKGMNKSEALGWSGTFMKQGIALFLLYFYEGPWSGKGINAMADKVKSAMSFSEEEYQKGTYGRCAANENDLFCELFLKWKSAVQMEPEIRTYAIKKITALLEKRTEGIMEANRRNYYGECAAYIAALGEVRESWGEDGAKQRLMTSYRDKYPRRSAFREEMSNYGWIDVKRK